MATADKISIYEAVKKMREMSARGESFSFKFRKWDRQRMRGGDLAVVTAAKLRPRAADEDVVHSSSKLYYVDTETGQQRVCWQPLIVEFNGVRTVLN